jgi:hypothetical protein
MNTENLSLPIEAADCIREALLIGIACYGLYVELDNACEVAKLCGHPWPEEARPIDPTGSADTVTKFAEAMRYLDIYERAARRGQA